MDKRMINYGYLWRLLLFCLLGALATVCKAVKITDVKIPAYYLLHADNTEPLVLDCEYDIGPEEEGFVLKWLLNEHLIYQWIAEKSSPHPMSFIKNQINLNYTASPERLHRYRALHFAKPSVNITGNYSCNVGTYKSEDKRTSFLQIIVPPAEFILDITEHDEQEAVRVECAAKDIFPEPKMKILISGKERVDFVKRSSQDDTDNLYDVTVFGLVPKEEINEPSDVTCILHIPNTNYTREKQGSQYSSSSHLVLSTSLVFTSFLTFLITKIIDRIA